MQNTSEPRQAVRALILDSDDRVLLVKFELPEVTLWATPGGGVEPGEKPMAALLRELVEETGLEVDRIGPPVWTREHRFRIGTVDYHQAETVYLVRTSPFEASPRLTWDELAGEGMVELRWWLPSELFEYGGVFAPKRLPELITEVIELGPPEVPIEAGV